MTNRAEKNAKRVGRPEITVDCRSRSTLYWSVGVNTTAHILEVYYSVYRCVILSNLAVNLVYLRGKDVYSGWQKV